jgi:hypothetical protein
MGMGMGMGMGMAFGATPPELGFRPLTLQFDLGPNVDPSFPERLLDKVCWKDRHGPWDPDVLSLTYLAEFIKNTPWDGIDIATDRPDLLKWQPANANFVKFVGCEIHQLQILMQTDRERYLGEIVAQHDNAPGYWESLMGINNRHHHHTLVVMNLAVRIGQVVAAYYKRKFERPRPSFVCPGLMPAFGPPAHASFPSGHSLQSWLLSLLLEKTTPCYKDELYWLAERVALNRERLGVHYPSDTAAGKFIAQKCVESIKAANCPEITDLLKKARSEWDPPPVASYSPPASLEAPL